MIVNFYRIGGFLNKINKSFQNVLVNVDCKLLDNTTVIEPEIHVEIDSVYNVDDFITSANYAQIPDFGRYYAITNIEIENSRIIKISLKSDPLTSFKTSIVNWQGEIEEYDDGGNNSYMREQSGIKGSFNNRNYLCSVNGETEYWGVNGSLDPLGGHDEITDSSVVVVFSGYNPVSSAIPNFVDPLQTGFFSAYASGSTMAGIRSLSDKFWGLDPATVVTSALLRPIDACLSMHILPFRPTGVATTTVNAGYMTLTLDSSVLQLGSSYKKLNLGTIEIIPSANVYDFRFYPPYRTYKLHLPFIGMVDINPNDFVTLDASGTASYCRVRIEYDVNMLTGDFLCTLHAVHTSLGVQTSLNPKVTHQGNLAVKLPVTGGDAASLASGCLNAVNTFSSYMVPSDKGDIGAGNGNPTGMLFSAGGMQKGTISGNTMYMGGNSDFWYDPKIYVTHPAQIIGPHENVNGYPSVIPGTVSIENLYDDYNLAQGKYLKFKSVRASLTDGMTLTECEEVKNILEGGCYL